MLPKLDSFMVGYFSGAAMVGITTWWQANRSRVAKSIRHYRETSPVVESED